MSFIITTDAPTTNYLVIVEDEHGCTPLYAVDDFDIALGLVRSLEVMPLYFTDQTEEIYAAM